MIIYVTRDDIVSENASSVETVQAPEVEKGASSVFGDVEKGKGDNSQVPCPASNIRKGRPDIAHLVTDCLSHCSTEDRIGVGACGPSDLITTVRKTVSQKEYDRGPSITFHSEVSH